VRLVKGSQYVKAVLSQSEGNNQQSLNQQMPSPVSTVSIDDAMGTQPALDALQMGLNAGRVRLAMQRKIAMTGRVFANTEALVAAVLDGQIEDEGFESPEADRRLESQVTQLLLSAVSSVEINNEQPQEQPSTSSCIRPNGTVPECDNKPKESSSASSSSLSLRQPPSAPMSEESENRRLKNVECKICMAEEVGVVFLPCGHLLSCVMCAPAMTNCPLCRQQIRGRVRTFLS